MFFEQPTHISAVAYCGLPRLAIWLQVYQCVKAKYLDDRESPVISLGVLANRCQAVWFVEYVWHKEGTNSGLTWQLQQCRVAPPFPGAQMPAGLLAHNLQLQDLENVKDQLGLSQFMLWANHEQAKAPQGFRWLTQYTEKLAERHGLPVTPVGLRPFGGQPMLTLADASVLAHGHRSLVLRLQPDDDFVVKIGKAPHISNEAHIHAVVDRADCKHLRKAVPELYGDVEGAGPGLSFIALQRCCHGSIQPHHLDSDEAKATYINQARAH